MVLIGSWCWPNGACWSMVTVWRGVAAVLLWMILLAEPIEWAMPGTDSTFTKERQNTFSHRQLSVKTHNRVKLHDQSAHLWPPLRSPAFVFWWRAAGLLRPWYWRSSQGSDATTCTVCINGCADVEDVTGVATVYVTGLIVCVNGRWTAIRTDWVVMGDAERENKH